jgi:hypothetical protein
MRANPAGAVYGTITVAVLLAAESPTRETYLRTVAAVVITLLMYWLAHSYAEFAGERLQTGESLTFEGLGRTMLGELWILIGAAMPLVAVLLCWAGGASLSTAVIVAEWVAAAIIIATEVVIGVRAELSGGKLLAQAAIGAVLGLLVIVLRIVLHH